MNVRNKSLSEVCAETGVTRRAVQGYEKAGLVSAAGRNKYGYLLYDEAGVERIKTIKFFQKVGFSIREIQEVIDAPAVCQKVALLERAEILKAKSKEISGLIEKINQYIAAL